jgi:hypothetical protein
MSSERWTGVSEEPDGKAVGRVGRCFMGLGRVC